MWKEVTQNNGTFTIFGLNFKHGLTTKQQGDFRSTETDRIQALAQRIEAKSTIIMKPMHGDTVVLRTANGNKLPLMEIVECDAIIYFSPAAHPKTTTAIIGNTGDCPYVFIADPLRRLIALIHCSRHTLKKGLLEKTISTILGKTDLKKRYLLFGIWPGIGPCCYNFTGKFNKITIDGSLNLAKLIVEKILNLQFPENQISVPGAICSSCHPDLFSHQKGDRESNGIFITNSQS